MNRSVVSRPPSVECPRLRRGDARPERGSALVIVLALVVLLTFLIVAFLTRSQTDLTASSNYSRAVQADEVAQLGSSFLISGLQQEIRQAMNKTGVKATIWPARSVLNDASSGGDPANPSIDERNPREFTAFRVSGITGPDFDAAYGTGVAATLPPNVASDVRTDTGRRPFDPARWNAPRLLPYTPRPGSDWVNCPSWVYVTRSGPKSPTAPAPYNATLAQMKNASDPANPDAVIGRFAYVMYDISGLLDINVAGAPLSGASLAEPTYGEKGSSAFANLSALFSSTAVASAGNAANFLAWKIPPATDFYDVVAGKKLGNVGLIEKGMLDALPGSNVFFSRQDLIKFSGDNPDLIRGGRSHRANGGTDADSGILKYLRTWSRSVNAPMVADAIPYPMVTADPRRAAVAVKIPRYKVSGTVQAVRDDYMVSAGEPLFQRKFPLARIRWFSDNDEKGQPKAEVRDAIKQHFGLVPVADLSSQSTSKEWVGVPGFMYTSPEGTTPAVKIKTLAEVAALPVKREPDFFEWLKAAIDPDSLGLSAGATSSGVAAQQDLSKDFQIVQIGANILDQVDVNDLPTLILTSVDNASDRNNQPLIAVGVENLPYINELIVSLKREGKWGEPQAENVDAWLQPEIWMPNYSADKVSTRAGYNDPAEISTFRMRVVDGIGWLDLYADYRSQGGTTSFNPLRFASEDFRTIVPRPFDGSTTHDASEKDDSLIFLLADEDFRDPKLPGQSSAPNTYNNGPMNGTASQLRESFAGPEPGAEGFKGIFAGRTLNCGIVPGPTGGKDYAQRRYFFTGGGNYELDEETDGAVRDPAMGVDGNGDSIIDPLTSVVSFPLGQKYYNAVRYLTTMYPSAKIRNRPSGNPLPLTVVLEAQVSGGAWVPVQILESVVFGRGKGAVITGNPTSSRTNQNWNPSGFDPTRETTLTNILPTGEMIPGYSYLFTTNQRTLDQTNPGYLCYFGKGNGGLVGGGNEVPEWLGWCRPILAGEDPDPANSIYPLGGTVALRQARARNDSDTRNPNEYLATNAGLPGKPGAGGGNEQRFSGLLFGWSTIQSRYSLVKTDPRTRRFGQGATDQGAGGGSSIRPTVSAWLAPSPQSFTNTNWDFVDIGPLGTDWDPLTGVSNGILPNWPATTGVVKPADLLRNIELPDSGFYREPKGAGTTVRPADYAYAPDAELPTLPTLTYPAALKARPVVLNRMFRSPAELGLVFRDVPWKSLDFFSAATVSGTSRTPTSGDTALLDVFCIEDTEFAAGRVDPNKAPKPVLEALLLGALEYPGRGAVTSAVSDQAEIQAIVDQFLGTISYDAANPLASSPLARDSDVVTALMTCDKVKPAGSGTRNQKSAAEAIIRGLSGSVDTRTWNLFIDVVAEAGRFPANSSSLGDFSPNAQRRCWIFVSLDRVTGRVIDSHYEIVNE